MPAGAVLCAERGPLWYPQLISFMQPLGHLMVSEEKQCPAMNTLGLAHNKFEFRGNMIVVSCVTLDKSHAAVIHRIVVSLKGNSTTSFCGSPILPGASHWSLPSFPICRITLIIPSIPCLSVI